MPYKTINEAEKKNEGLKKYSEKAKRGWLGSFNQCMSDGGPEDKCYAIAYSVANKVDGRKPTTKSSVESNAAAGLLKVAKELLSGGKTLMKKGDWYLYDRYGFKSNFKGWRSGPKFVKVLSVKLDDGSSVFNEYVLESYDETGKRDERYKTTQRQLEDFRNQDELDESYKKISKPKFRKVAPKIDVREVKSLAKKHLRWFEEEEDMLWITRENGDVGSEEPGDEDIRAAQLFARDVKRKVPGAKVEIEAVDEWVHVSVSQAKSI